MGKIRPQILAIDDIPGNLQALGAALDIDFDLQIATSGAMGLLLAKQYLPDVILLDVMMPDMDGFETCRRLKADPELQHIPVIFLTALSDSASETTGLTLGAQDYITKPINVETARQRIRNLLERDRLRLQVTAQRNELQAMVVKLSQAGELLEGARLRELATGRNIQLSLLQSNVPAGIKGAIFGIFSEPSQGIDGDFYDIRRLSDDCFDVLVGDVMGKGVQAALIGAGVKAAYHRGVSDLLIANLNSWTLPTPAALVNQLHQELTPRLIELASFVTLALYRFDLKTGRLTYVNAGHTTGLLMRADCSTTADVLGDNLPIGISLEERYVENSLAIGPNDSLMLYSDGITEARSTDGQEFGLERLIAQFEVWPKVGSVDEKLAALSESLKSFSGGKPAIDDQSVVLIELHEKF
jgi:sigma-B regulation protein RsbU (phosphoserine phosphatase)